jgi:hypothetical protein
LNQSESNQRSISHFRFSPRRRVGSGAEQAKGGAEASEGVIRKVTSFLADSVDSFVTVLVTAAGCSLDTSKRTLASAVSALSQTAEVKDETATFWQHKGSSTSWSSPAERQAEKER